MTIPASASHASASPLIRAPGWVVERNSLADITALALPRGEWLRVKFDGLVDLDEINVVKYPWGKRLRVERKGTERTLVRVK